VAAVGPGTQPTVGGGALIGAIVGGGGYVISWSISSLWDAVVGDEEGEDGEGEGEGKGEGEGGGAGGGSSGKKGS